MKKACFLFIAMTLLSTHAMGEEPPQWFYDAIKVDNPNQLAYFLSMAKVCPFTKEALEEIVDGVFVRSRIKPLKEGAFWGAPVYLSLSVNCMSRKNSNPIYVIGMRFGRYKPLPAVLFDKDLGPNFGIGRPETIKQIFKENVERAIT